MPIDVQFASPGAASMPVEYESISVSAPCFFRNRPDEIRMLTTAGTILLLGTAGDSLLFADQTTDYYFVRMELSSADGINNIILTFIDELTANASAKHLTPAWEMSPAAIRFEFGEHSYTAPGNTERQTERSSYDYYFDDTDDAALTFLTNIHATDTTPTVTITFLGGTVVIPEASLSGLVSPSLGVEQSYKNIEYSVIQGFASTPADPATIDLTLQLFFHDALDLANANAVLLGEAGASPLFSDQASDYYIDVFNWIHINTEEFIRFRIRGESFTDFKDLVSTWETSPAAIRLEYGEHSFTMPGPAFASNIVTDTSSPYAWRFEESDESVAFRTNLFNIFGRRIPGNVRMTLLGGAPITDPNTSSGLLANVGVRLALKDIEYITFRVRSG